ARGGGGGPQHWQQRPFATAHQKQTPAPPLPPPPPPRPADPNPPAPSAGGTFRRFSSLSRAPPAPRVAEGRLPPPRARGGGGQSVRIGGSCWRGEDLAGVRARLHARRRGGRLRKGKGAVDQRPDPARRDQRQHVLLHGARDRALVGDRARAQGRTGVGEALE